MLPFTMMNRDNTISYAQTRIPRWQIYLYRLFHWYYKARAEKNGFYNDYNPEPAVTNALAEKSLQLKERMDWNQALKSCRFVVFDTETTGFYPYQGDEIIAIGGVVVENGTILQDSTFHELVNPYRSIPAVVTELTGISNEMVADKRGICDVLSDFLDFIGDATLVAHNAEFDLAFINIKLNWYTQTEIYNPVIDTYKVARALLPELMSHDLDTLLKYHHVEVNNRHNALGDSLMTARIFVEFLNMLEQKKIETLKQLFYYLHVKNNLAFCT